LATAQYGGDGAEGYRLQMKELDHTRAVQAQELAVGFSAHGGRYGGVINEGHIAEKITRR
jgi:hypothetical protein